MRFLLTLRPQSDRQRLIFNYQYPLQAWLYARLQTADADYARFLHERGYKIAEGRKTFKHFTFSALLNTKTDPIKKGDSYMVLHNQAVQWVVSFYVDKAAENFIIGLFQEQQLSIYNREYRADFLIERVETLPDVHWGEANTVTARFKTISPMVVAEKTEGLDQYLTPTDALFNRYFAINLWDKYRSISENQQPQLDARTIEQLIRFRLLTEPERIRKKGIFVKEGKLLTQTKVIGYDNFSFELTAPVQLIDIGFWSGFGRFCSMGCGCVEVVRVEV